MLFILTFMSHQESLIQQIPLIEECLGYTFNNKNLLALAFVHRSFFNEHRDVMKEHNRADRIFRRFRIGIDCL